GTEDTLESRLRSAPSASPHSARKNACPPRVRGLTETAAFDGLLRCRARVPVTSAPLLNVQVRLCGSPSDAHYGGCASRILSNPFGGTQTSSVDASQRILQQIARSR